MLIHRLILHICVMALALFAVPASAWDLDSVSSQHLISMCRESGDAAGAQEGYTSCEAYLMGFFAGSRDVVVEEELPSAYIMRVLETRGRRLNREDQKIINARYCISKEESIQAIAAKIAAADPQDFENGNAIDVIRLVLNRHYQCER